MKSYCLAYIYIPKYIYVKFNVFFSPFGIFCSSDRGSFLVLSAPWHTGSPSGPNAQVWALAEVRGTCSGGWRWHVRSRRHSEHVEPSRPMPTHVHNTILSGSKTSDVSCDIWHLECHQCVQTLRAWWWKSFSPTPWKTCDHFYHNKMKDIVSSHAYDHSMVGPFTGDA